MQYILTQEEYDALTPVKRLQERNEALEVARQLIISDKECYDTHYCSDCKIGQLLRSSDKNEQAARHHICIKPKNYAK